MGLVDYAKEEMTRAGLYDKDADYSGLIPDAVMALVKAHAEQGHSGGSHAATLAIFNRVINFKPLSPLTSNAEEWMDMSGPSGYPLWQSKRDPSVFSKDGGKTWQSIDEMEKKTEQPN